MRRLTQAETIQVSKWLDSRKEEIESEGVPISNLASAASVDLGFSVSQSSIVSIGDATGIEFPKRRGVGGIGGYGKKRLDEMAADIETLKNEIRELRELITS